MSPSSSAVSRPVCAASRITITGVIGLNVRCCSTAGPICWCLAMPNARLSTLPTAWRTVRSGRLNRYPGHCLCHTAPACESHADRLDIVDEPGRIESPSEPLRGHGA
ncbi:MAG: hypothetical protein CM15mP125_1760 [Gammaproteobacteria bacterium]|nr:MAG: hypothetical protein CM15mP125_1760 [Gammaproteobacteria bacterium]